MTLKLQTIISVVGNVTYLFAQWMLTVLTTRILGYEAVGILTLAMSLGNVFVFVQFYGVRSFQSSDISRQYSSGDYFNARITTVLFGILACIVFVFICRYEYTVISSIVLFTLFRTFESISDVFFGEYQREGRLELVGYTMFLRGMLAIGFFYIGLIVFQSLNAALFIIVIESIGMTLLVDGIVYKKIVPWKSGTLEGLKGILKECFPLLLATLLPTVITAFPRIALEQYYGTELLGFYGNVSTPAVIIITVVPTILASFMPVYGNLVVYGDNKTIRKLWKKTIIGTIVIMILCIIGVAFLGEPILSWIYTDAIAPYVHYLYYVLLATTLYAFTMCGAAVLTALRKNTQVCVCALISTIICLMISFPLIKAYSIAGAISVLIVSYMVQVIIQAVIVLQYTRESDEMKMVGR